MLGFFYKSSANVSQFLKIIENVRKIQMQKIKKMVKFLPVSVSLFLSSV